MEAGDLFPTAKHSTLMRATAHVRKLSERDREKDDYYATPPASTLALLRVETFPHKVWEPACGDGAICRVLASHGHDVVATDLVDRGFGDSRRDFLFERDLLAPAVVTNPPFKLADEFTHHALALGAEKVAIFQRTAWLEGHKRHASLWSKTPPVRIWQFSGRQTLWRGDDENPKDRGGAIAFAWFVFERGNTALPTLGWI